MKTLREETIETLIIEHNFVSEGTARLFLARAEKRGSGFATGNASFPIQYTPRQMRGYVAKRLQLARTVQHEMNKKFDFHLKGWGRQYFKGLVVGMSEMVDAIVNNDVDV